MNQSKTTRQECKNTSKTPITQQNRNKHLRTLVFNKHSIVHQFGWRSWASFCPNSLYFSSTTFRQFNKSCLKSEGRLVIVSNNCSVVSSEISTVRGSGATQSMPRTQNHTFLLCLTYLSKMTQLGERFGRGNSFNLWHTLQSEESTIHTAAVISSSWARN